MNMLMMKTMIVFKTALKFCAENYWSGFKKSLQSISASYEIGCRAQV